VPVPEQVLHLDDVHVGVEQQRGRGGVEAVETVASERRTTNRQASGRGVVAGKIAQIEIRSTMLRVIYFWRRS
jgi:hypothetical protein